MKRHGLTALVLVWMVSALVLSHGTLCACEKCGHADHHDAACHETACGETGTYCNVCAATVGQREILPEHTWLSGVVTDSCQAMLCSNCGFGTKKDYCVKCGRWLAGSGEPARLCSSCGFGNKKDYCIKCGRWVANNGVPAMICSSCAFGNKKNYCFLCGRWLGN